MVRLPDPAEGLPSTPSRRPLTRAQHAANNVRLGERTYSRFGIGLGIALIVPFGWAWWRILRNQPLLLGALVLALVWAAWRVRRAGRRRRPRGQ